MENPLFSVIIPTYNRAGVISRCLKSVINQTYSNWEAIVIDNFSDDNTEEIVQGFGDNRIHYYKNHNYGVISVSRNFGLDRAQGNWVCFLDSDDAWMPEKLEALLPYLEQFDLIYHGYKSNGKKRYPWQKNGSLFYTIKEATVAYMLQRGDAIHPSSSAVRRSFIGETRFSEEKALFAIEDYDFFLQLLDKGPRLLHLKKYLSFYDVSTGVSHNSEAHRRRSKVLYAKWKSKLTQEEYRNVLCIYMGMLAGDFYTTNPCKARHYYRVMAESTVPEIKSKAIGYVLKTYLWQILRTLKK